MAKRLTGGSSANKEKKYKMHYAKLETKKRKQKAHQAQIKQDWDNDPIWQRKKKAIRLEKIERKRKKREHNSGL